MDKKEHLLPQDKFISLSWKCHLVLSILGLELCLHDQEGAGPLPSFSSDVLNILMKHDGCISSGHHIPNPISRKDKRLKKGTCFLRTLLEGSMDTSTCRCKWLHLVTRKCSLYFRWPCARFKLGSILLLSPLSSPTIAGLLPPLPACPLDPADFPRPAPMQVL